MTATILGDIMDALGVALATVPNLRVFDFPPQSAVPPFAFVDMPLVTYDLTYGRARDRFTFLVYVGVGTQVDRATRDRLAEYAAGTSIKAAIEGITAFACRVTQAEFTQIGLAGGSYPGVIFTVDVAA